MADFFREKYGKDWIVSPEQSLQFHAGNWTVPKQLLIRSSEGSNYDMPLPHETSLLVIKAAIPSAENIETNPGNQMLYIARFPGFFLGQYVFSKPYRCLDSSCYDQGLFGSSPCVITRRTHYLRRQAGWCFSKYWPGSHRTNIGCDPSQYFRKAPASLPALSVSSDALTWKMIIANCPGVYRVLKAKILPSEKPGNRII